jgi:cytochrome c
MLRTALALCLALGRVTAAAALYAGAPTAGATVFKKCAPCHRIGEGAENSVGPELNGLFGRPAGSVPGYAYSDANKTSGIVWSPEIFADYIRAPQKVVKGTKMTFAGLKKDKDVADIIAYLAQFNADGTVKQP